MYPDCAAAHAELAQTYLHQEKSFQLRHASAERVVRHAVHCAMQLDSHACTTLASLALQDLRYDWNWAAAEKHFRAALSVNAFAPDALVEYATMLMLMGRFSESSDCLSR